MKTTGGVSVFRSLSAPVRVLGFLLLLLSLSRLVLMVFYSDRIAATGGNWFIFLQGIRFDIILMGMLLGPALLAAPWLTGRRPGATLLRYYLVAVTIFIVWVELGTIPYIDQYDARPNYIYVEYLKYPREIISMLLASYGLLMVVVALVTLCFVDDVWRFPTL